MSDLTNVNPGMIIGSAVGSAPGPFINAAITAARVGISAEPVLVTAANAIGGGFAGNAEYLGGRIWSASVGAVGDPGNHWTAGSQANGTPWAGLWAPSGATSWGMQNLQGTLSTPVPTYWAPGNGKAPVNGIPAGNVTGGDFYSYDWATTAGFGGGGDYSFAPGGGGWITQAIEKYYVH